MVLVECEMKVTELVGKTIDAPVENNPIIPFCGKNGNDREANNLLQG